MPRFASMKRAASWKAIVAAVMVLILIASSFFLGMRYEERQSIYQNTQRALLQIALNLQLIDYVRQGRTEGAIDAVNANIVADLVYVWHYRGSNVGVDEQSQLRTRVLGKLNKEWIVHPPKAFTVDDTNGADPDVSTFRREMSEYLRGFDTKSP